MMSSDNDIRAIMDAKRESVKHKERRPFRLDERMELRLRAVQDLVYRARIVLDDWQIREGYHRAIGEYEFIDSDWRDIRLGESWGGEDISAFFRRRVVMPPQYAGEPVVLRIYFGGDALLSLNGVSYQSVDPFHSEVRLTDCAKGDESYDVGIEAYVTWHGKGEPLVHKLQLAEIATLDRESYEAYWDLQAVFKALAIEDMDNGLRSFLEGHLWQALKEVPIYEEEADLVKAGLLRAQTIVREGIYESDRFRGEGLMHLVGNSHLDLVFLWPYREFVRKIGRTHASMLRLMEEYPGFKFSQSQAKIYADMKEYYPSLYSQVKERVSEGRWEPVGAFWVEPDCNLISGESFVRQIMYGQRFWREEFGVQSRTCWQPDVFGMSWAMPQILHRSGIEYVMTNKYFIWNDTNRWRKNTFWWEGRDGSRVLVVVPPSHFIGMVDPDHMHDHWRDFSDKKTVGESMYCYGWGDGGAGVNREMLECAVRYEDFPGLVKTTFSTGEEAFDSIRARAEKSEIPVWHDELYLEAHRGTYTTKGLLKKLNRRCESLYREAEIAAALAWAKGRRYPAENFDEGWRALLTTQFHDSLPGTHVGQVYHELLPEYGEIESLGNELRDEALCSLLSRGMLGVGNRESVAGALIVFNSLLHARNDVVSLPASLLSGRALVGDDGNLLTQQSVADLDGTEKVIFRVPKIPGVGYRVFQLAAESPASIVQSMVEARVDTAKEVFTLENEYLRATFNAQGELVSLWDKENEREVIVCGEVGNKFQLFEDAPGKYDAWDIIAGYREHEIDISGGGSLAIGETGPVRASLLLERPFRKSLITQRICLYAGSRELVFETKVDWVERQKLLKVAFPVEVNAHSATYDIAFGNMERPNHGNTSYDAARFEVPAHQWMDLSEGAYGVSLMNDCKYGHEAYGKLMRLSLLKGPIHPDPESDIGEHTFTYSLYPHAGSWREAGTIQAALNLNNPLYVRLTEESGQQSSHRFVECDADNLTLEAVKRSEDGQHLVIRLVERYNARTRTRLGFDRPIKAAWACNLMEEEESELRVNDGALELTIAPSEIVTLRLAF